MAPFRGFWRELSHTKSGREAILVFGCTNPDKDFIYKDEVDKMSAEGILTECIFAFSRVQKQKVYVQHKLEENKEKLRKWLDAGAYIFVCGSGKMGMAIA